MRRSPVARGRTNTGGLARALPLVFVSAFVLNCPCLAPAQTWNGSVSDLWDTAGNWTPAAVPNSATAGATINSGKNNPVLVNGNFTVGNLTLVMSNSVDIQNNETLTIAGGSGFGTVDNAGTIGVTSTGKRRLAPLKRQQPILLPHRRRRGEPGRKRQWGSSGAISAPRHWST